MLEVDVNSRSVMNLSLTQSRLEQSYEHKESNTSTKSTCMETLKCLTEHLTNLELEMRIEWHAMKHAFGYKLYPVKNSTSV